MSSQTLEGIRVLDLSRVLAAPLCTQWLADLGAEVIKVERPNSGDDSRGYGPPFFGEPQGGPGSVAAFYLSCNRNKQSITIDHSTAEGQRLIRSLVERCDVLVENFRPGVLKKYGLDFESLCKLNPRLIYLSITGFGQNGPLAERPGYDGIFQAMCGMMSVSGYPEEPMKVGASMVDILTSLFGAIGILSAIRHRDVSNEGQFIDLALLDCGLASLSHLVMNYLIAGSAQERRGNGGFGGIPSQLFQCSDKPIFVVAGTNQQFAALCKAAKRLDIYEDSRFNSMSARITHRLAITPILNEVFKSKSRDEWLALLDAADVPASPINELPEVFSNVQVQHRQMLVPAECSQRGPLNVLANPIKFSATPIKNYSAPPELGEHTEEVLKRLLGLTQTEIQSLRSVSAI